MKARATTLAILSAVLLVLAGCGGGGGGGDPGASGGSSPGDPGSSSGGGASAVFPGFDFSLTAGNFWRFGWDAERSSFAMSDETSGSASGTFQITLGESRVISGTAMYPVQLSGNPTAIVDGTSVSLAPRWKYLGIDQFRLLGSSDGATLKTIFDAQTGHWAGGGFFTTLPETALVTAASASLSNAYISESAAVRAGVSSDQDLCEIIAGIRICGDSSHSSTDFDYFKAGVGPIGHLHRNSFSDCGGGFCSGGSSEYHVGLVASSLRGDNVDEALEVEPNNTVAQAMSLALPAVVAGASLNEGAYGGPAIILTEAEPNDAFGSAELFDVPGWVGGSVQEDDGGTSITIPPLDGVPEYTTKFEDFYKFTASETGALIVELDFPNTGADLDLYAFTLPGGFPTIIRRSIDDDSEFDADFEESMQLPVDAGTTYYIAIDGFAASSHAAYELRIYGFSDPIPSGLSVVDWFEVQLTAPQALSVSISGGPQVLITDATGNTVLARAIPATPGGGASRTTSVLPAGTYLIGVSSGGAYDLTVN